MLPVFDIQRHRPHRGPVDTSVRFHPGAAGTPPAATKPLAMRLVLVARFLEQGPEPTWNTFEIR